MSQIHKLMNLSPDTPINMAKSSCNVAPNARDIAGATRGSCWDCAYARSAERKAETKALIKRLDLRADKSKPAHGAFFGLRIAYLVELNEHGAPVLRKYDLPVAARTAIKKFDMSRGMVPHSVDLLPLAHSRTPEAIAKRDKATKAGKRAVVARGPRKAPVRHAEYRTFQAAA